MPSYTIYIKKLTKLSPNNYFMYRTPNKSSSNFQLPLKDVIKVYIPDRVKISHTIHDYNHLTELDTIKEGIYHINIIYNTKYENYFVTTISLISLNSQNNSLSSISENNSLSSFSSIGQNNSLSSFSSNSQNCDLTQPFMKTLTKTMHKSMPKSRTNSKRQNMIKNVLEIANSL